jgi:hypothetical protein
MSQQIDKILNTILPNNNLPQFKQQIQFVNEIIELLDSHINKQTINEDVQLYIPCDVKLSLLNKQLCELQILLESHKLTNTVNHSREFISDMSEHINKLYNDYISLSKHIENKINTMNSDDIEAKIKCLQDEEFKILEQMTINKSEDLLIKLLQIKNYEQFFQEKYQDKQYLSKSLITITQKLDILKEIHQCIKSEISQNKDYLAHNLPIVDKKNTDYLPNRPEVNQNNLLLESPPFSNKYMTQPIRQVDSATNNKNFSIQPMNSHQQISGQSMNGFTSYLYNTDILDQKNYENLQKHELKYKSTDVNKDITLRKKVIKYYRNHLIKWIKNENIDISESIKTDYGITKIYSLLKEYVKENNVNWYDLRDHHNDIKKFIKNELF